MNDGLTAKLAEALVALEDYRERERLGVAEDSELFLAERESLREVLTPLMASGLGGAGAASPWVEGGVLPDAGDEVGDYRIERELARGGMGVVFEAHDRRLERRVALKFIRPELLQSAAVRQRFTREARVVAPLAHPGLCRIFGVGEHRGVPWLAMEFLDGRVWAEDVAAGVSFAVWLERFARVAEALDVAHRAGAVHRDLKPSNVLTVVEDGRPVVLDFGLAALVDDRAHSMTGSLDRLGTPLYMAPEQVRGELVDVRTDVWGLGVTMYEVLTGERPFDRVSRHEVQRAILDLEPRPVHHVRRDLPRDLGTVVATCLQKDPERRYRDCAELAADLDRVRNREPIRARPVAQLERAVRWCRRHPLPSGLIAALVVALSSSVSFAVLAESRAVFAERETLRADAARGDAEQKAQRVRALRAAGAFEVGRLAASNGEWDRARDAYEASARLGHDPDMVDVALARLFASSNQLELANQWLDRLDQRQLEPRLRALVDLLQADPSRVVLESMDLEDVRMQRRRIRPEELDGADAAWARSLCADTVAEARRELEACLVADGRHREANELLASLLVFFGNADEAVEHALRFQARFPADPISSFHVALARMRRGDAERVRDLRPAVQLAPEFATVAESMFAIRRAIGRIYETDVGQLEKMTRTGEMPSRGAGAVAAVRTSIAVVAQAERLRKAVESLPLRACPAVPRTLLSLVVWVFSPGGPDPGELDPDRSDALLWYRASTAAFRDQRPVFAADLLDSASDEHDVLGIGPIIRRLRLLYLMIALGSGRLEPSDAARARIRGCIEDVRADGPTDLGVQGAMAVIAGTLEEYVLGAELALGWLAQEPDNPAARIISRKAVEALSWEVDPEATDAAGK